MKILRFIVPSVALAACSLSTPQANRTISGQLTAEHPTGTSVLAVGSAGRRLAPLNADGTFTVAVRSTDSYVLKFILDRQVLGTILRSDGTPLVIHRGATAVTLGAVGTDAQPLTAATAPQAGDCSGMGEPVEAENEAAIADASDGDGEVQDEAEAVETETSADDLDDAAGDSQHENTDACGQNEEGEH